MIQLCVLIGMNHQGAALYIPDALLERPVEIYLMAVSVQYGGISFCRY